MIFISSEDELQISEGLSVIYFYANWMPYHKKMIVMIDKVHERFPKLKVFAVNTDNFKNQCKRYSVKNIPAVLAFRDGVEIKRLTGCIMTSAFKKVFCDALKE